MKIDVIDSRGFVKTPPTYPIKKEFKISGQVEKDRLIVSVCPLKPSIK